MSALVARVSPRDFSLEELEILEKAAQLIEQGGTVVFPTETVYGLGANGLSPLGAEKIYKAKGRPSDNPLIVHISDYEMLELIATNISAEARVLMDKFWPGPLTLIFDKKEIVPEATTGGLSTVAVRMPSHLVALELIKRAGVPIAAPSANVSGRPSITASEYALREMADRVDMILLSEDCEIGLESTVCDMTGEIPIVLRPGKISQREIFQTLATSPEALENYYEKLNRHLKVLEGKVSEDGIVGPKSPGMKYRHYSPEAKVLIANSGKGLAMLKDVVSKAKAEELKGDSSFVRVFCLAKEASIYGEWAEIIGETLEEAGRNIFTRLRKMDDQGVKVIICETLEGETPSEMDLAKAIMNRLIKAASNK